MAMAFLQLKTTVLSIFHLEFKFCYVWYFQEFSICVYVLFWVKNCVSMKSLDKCVIIDNRPTEYHVIGGEGGE